MEAGRIWLRVPDDFIRPVLVVGVFLFCLGGTIVPAAAQGQWERVAGAASDIAIANDGTTWMIGAGAANRIAGGFRIFSSGAANVQWTAVPGAAMRIAVEGQVPWVVNEAGSIYRWDGRQWSSVSGPKAVDIGASAKGVWVVAEPKRGDDYSTYQWMGSAWKPVTPGAGLRLDVDADGNPWVVSSAGLVHAYVDGQWRQFGLARDAQGQYDTASDIAVDIFGAPWVVSKRGELWYFNKNSPSADKWERRVSSATVVAQRSGRTWYLGRGNEIFRSPHIAVVLNPQLNVSQQQPGNIQLQVTEGTVQTQLKVDPGTAPQTTPQVSLSQGELKEGNSASLPGPGAGQDIQVSGCATAGNNLMLKEICEGKAPRGETPAAYGVNKFPEPGMAAFLDQGGAALLERSVGDLRLMLGILNDPKTQLLSGSPEAEMRTLCMNPDSSPLTRELLFVQLLEVIKKDRSQRTRDEQKLYDAFATYIKRRKLFTAEASQKIYDDWLAKRRRDAEIEGRLSSLAGVFNLHTEIPAGGVTAFESALPIGIAGAGAATLPIISIAQAWPVFVTLFPHATKLFQFGAHAGSSGMSAASGLLGRMAASGVIAGVATFAIVGSTIAIINVVRAEDFWKALDSAIKEGKKTVDLERMAISEKGVAELAYWWLAATSTRGPVRFRVNGDGFACQDKSMKPSAIPASLKGGRFERTPAAPGGYDALSSFSNLQFAGTKTTLVETVWQAMTVARINCFDVKKVETYFKTGVAGCAGGQDTGPPVKLAGWVVPAATAAPAAKTSPLSWIAVSGRNVPSTALIAGKHKSGTGLAVCRADMGDGIHPGKVWGANCIVGWGGREVARPNYDVLSAASGEVKWVAARNGQSMPANAVVAGKHRSGPNLLVCRADMGDGIHPGKVWNGRCHVGWGGKEVVKPAFDVLVSAPQ